MTVSAPSSVAQASRQRGHRHEPQQRPERAAVHAAAPTGSEHRGAVQEANHPVGAQDQLGAMRDHQHRPPGLQAPDRAGHDGGALGVEVGGRLVEDHQRCVSDERPREGDPPALARRQGSLAIADDRGVPVGQRPRRTHPRPRASRRARPTPRSPRGRRGGCSRRRWRETASGAAAPRRS